MGEVKPLFTDNDARDAYEYTKALSYPRLVGSEGEKKTREYIFNEFNRLGVQVSREEFKCSNIPINVIFRIVSPIVGTLLLLSGIFYLIDQEFLTELFYLIQFSPLALIFSLATFILAFLSATIQKQSFGRFTNIGKTCITENIIGHLPAENPRANLIYMGHYDSKSQLFPALLRVLLFIIGMVWAVIISFEMLIGQFMIMLGYSQEISSNPYLFELFHFNIWSFVLPFLINFLLLFNTVGNKSPGALDNASAVGIILALAKKIALENPLKSLNLYFIASGAEELGLYGADAYIKKHKPEFNPKNTYFLVYDSPAMKGEQKILTGYGLPKLSTSKELNQYLMEIGKEQEIKVGSIYLPLGAATDHVPIQKNGYEVAVVVSYVKRVHSSKDDIKYITIDGLKKAAILGYELAKKIDEKYK